MSAPNVKILRFAADDGSLFPIGFIRRTSSSNVSGSRFWEGSTTGSIYWEAAVTLATSDPISAAAGPCRILAGSLLACLLLAACTDVPDLPPATSAPPMQITYLVQPGDTLDVKFVKNPELNEQPTVQPDGRISLLYAPNLLAGGHSTEELRLALDESYS